MIEVKWSEVFLIFELSEKCGQTLSWDFDVSSQLKLNGKWRNQIIKKNHKISKPHGNYFLC